MNKDKVVFFGSGDFGIDTLISMIECGTNIVGVVTSRDFVNYHDKRIEEIAKENLLPCYIIRDGDMERDEWLINFLDKLKADVYCVISFKKLPMKIVNMAKKCAFNVHASILPFYRGKTPIETAIYCRATETGLTAFLLNDKIDCGDIIANCIIPIGEHETYRQLYNKLSKECVELTHHVLNDVITNPKFKLNAIKQITYGKGFCTFDFSDEVKSNDMSIWNNIDTLDRLCRCNDFGVPCNIEIYDQEIHKKFNSKEELTVKPLKVYKARIYNIDYDLKADEWDGYDSNNIIPVNLKKFRVITDGKHYMKISEKDKETSYSCDITDIQIVGKKRMDIKSFLNGLHESREEGKFIYISFDKED